MISAFRGGGPLESSHDWWSTGSGEWGMEFPSFRVPQFLSSSVPDSLDSDDAVLSPHWHRRLCNYRQPRCDHRPIPIPIRIPTDPIRYDRGFSFGWAPACNYFLLNLHHMWNMSKS